MLQDLLLVHDLAHAAGAVLYQFLAPSRKVRSQLPMSRMHVLLLCTGNSCRSQMAAAFLRARRPAWSIESAGTHPEAAVMPHSMDVCIENAWPPPQEQPKRWAPEGRQQPDAVWVFSKPALDAVRRRRPDWPMHEALVPDPIGRGIEAYRQSAEAIAARLEGWLTTG